jgi:hypothetical protein
VLVVALLVAALIALLLGSYLSLNLGTARLAQRTFNRTAAFHLAEAGLEEGLWTYNQLLARAPAPWTDWQVASDAAWRRFDNFQLSPSTSGSIKIYASPASLSDTALPNLVALATVTSPGGAPVTQLLEVTLRRRSLFGGGLVARDGLVFRGNNTSFDSWDSDPDQNPATPAIPYSARVRSDLGTIATGAATAGDLFIAKTRIHGFIHTAGIDPVIGSTGLIGPFGTADGVIDSTRLAHDYHADFPGVSPPSGGTLLPSFGTTLGTLGQKTLWRANSLRLNGNKSLTILGDVTLVLTDLLTAVSITGNAQLIIPAGSSLQLYCDGDVLIGGRGLANLNNAPASFQIWGGATSSSNRAQSLALVGNGTLAAVAYSPEGHITINGNGSIHGALVGRTITFTGNAAFHYDLALGRLASHAPFRASGWSSVDDPARRAALLPLVDR